MLICWMNCYKRMCLEMMPSWCRQVNWGNCEIPWANCAVLCERLQRPVLRPALLPVKTAQFTQFFRQVWRLTVKSLSLTERVGPFTVAHRILLASQGGMLKTLIEQLCYTALRITSGCACASSEKLYSVYVALLTLIIVERALSSWDRKFVAFNQ